jgi:hypothetical protein
MIAKFNPSLNSRWYFFAVVISLECPVVNVATVIVVVTVVVGEFDVDPGNRQLLTSAGLWEQSAIIFFASSFEVAQKNVRRKKAVKKVSPSQNHDSSNMKKMILKELKSSLNKKSRSSFLPFTIRYLETNVI